MPKTIDLVGKRFGELVVIKQCGYRREQRLWKCQCDCGKFALVVGYNLRSGATQSCGCRRLRSRAVEVGQKYSRLTAVCRQGHVGGEPAFLFKCDCGVEKVLNAQAVRRGLTKSCGCYRREHCAEISKLGAGRDGLAYLRFYFKEYRTRAIAHGIAFDLSLEAFAQLIGASCFYCGAFPSPRQNRYGSYVVNGIDRKDSGGGYTGDNTVSCCSTCNHGKHVLTVEEFKQWITAVYNHFVRA